LFEQRKNEALQSRIRFKIQDLIDAYNKDWRFIISESKNRVFDNEGFKQIYVPKDQILTEDQVFHHGSSRFGKDKDGKKRRDSQSKGYYYKAKSPAKEEKKEPTKKANTMASLLMGLKPDALNKMIGQDDEVSEDEDVKGFVERRLSMNQFNMAGMNFQKYQESKPSQGVRREILNMFNEYKEFEDKNHAREELVGICKQYEIKVHQFLGYFLNNSLAEKPDDFRQYMTLVFEYFFEDQKLLDAK
jgi:hypothetical protein